MFPIGDWQFWVVSAVALVAAWLVLRKVIPTPGKKRRARERKASLTVEGRTPEK
ncbi:MAG: hypothetical protein AB7Q00_03830 [Phycisphaerales bacterium]